MSVATLPAPAPVQSTSPSGLPAAAEFVGVSKTYFGLFRKNSIAAVQDVSFTVPAGEVFGLLGPNRAGKTTLIKMLLSLCRPTGGEVRRLGRPVSDRSTLARVGYVHENHAFPRYLGAAALLEYYGALSLLPQEVLGKRVPELLDRVGLADRSREPIARFSKGMLQRLGIAQALLTEPQLLVLDEPTEGLDLDGRHLLRDAVREVRERGGSVLLVSHVLSEVEELCTRLAVIGRGRVLHVGPVAELTRRADVSPRSLEKALEEMYASAIP
jgi:ABC-2 type transport system ATP-binding protein